MIILSIYEYGNWINDSFNYCAIKRSQIIDYLLRKFGNHLTLGLPKFPSQKKRDNIISLKPQLIKYCVESGKRQKGIFLC